jgi:adenylate cyclase
VGMKVLLVDDDPATLDVLEFALTLEGHQVLRALDGSEGLSRAQEDRPDVIIVDSMMPVMDGITLTRLLRADADLKHIPILMLTAKVMSTDVWAGWQAGVDSYITKPLDFQVLQAEIDRVAGAAA